MKNEKILVINPGSTSTKIAVFLGETELWKEDIVHSLESLAQYETIFDQLEMRRDLILDCLAKHGDTLESFVAFVARGGNMPPVEAGAYEVNDRMTEALHYRAVDQHAANIGAPIALEFARKAGVKAYIYDALTIDEMLPVHTITGMKGVRRKARGHNLNTRAAALKVCKKKGLRYDQCNIIVAHMGGGTTVNLHSGGKIVDTIMDEEGPFSPGRTGGLPNQTIIDLCFSGNYTDKEVRDLLTKKGGMISWFGTADLREIQKMIEAGNEEAKLVFEAMALETAKNIAKIAPDVDGKIDFIIFTGGLAYSEPFVAALKKHISFLAPIELVPGENEMTALADGALRVLRGEEQAKIFEA